MDDPWVVNLDRHWHRYEEVDRSGDRSVCWRLSLGGWDLRVYEHYTAKREPFAYGWAVSGGRVETERGSVHACGRAGSASRAKECAVAWVLHDPKDRS